MNIRCDPLEDTKFKSLPHRVFWVSDFFSWMDGGAIHGNGSISMVLLPSPFLITALCKKDDYISSLFSLRIVFIDPSSWIKSHCYRFLWSPFDIHPTGDHCLIGLPVR